MSKKKDSLLRHPAFSDIDWRKCSPLSGHTIPWLFDYQKQDFDHQQPQYDLDEYLSDIIRIAREELAKHGIEVDEEKGTVPGFPYGFNAEGHHTVTGDFYVAWMLFLETSSLRYKLRDIKKRESKSVVSLVSIVVAQMAEIVEHLHLTDSNELRHLKSEPDIDMRNEEIRRLRYSGEP